MEVHTDNHKKQKDKIRKLLELSLSDNPNEAAIALRQALAMMNKHNITKSEVHGQQIVDQMFDAPYYRLPDWYIKLNHFMGSICF